MGKLVPVFINTLASWIRKSAERSTTFAPWANKSGYHFHGSAAGNRQRKTTSQAFAQVSASKTLISTSLPGTLRKRISSVFPLRSGARRRQDAWPDARARACQFHARIAAYADKANFNLFHCYSVVLYVGPLYTGPAAPTLAITLDDVFEPELAKQAFRSEDPCGSKASQCLCRSISRTSILCLAKSISFSQFRKPGRALPQAHQHGRCKRNNKKWKSYLRKRHGILTSSLTHKPPVISVKLGLYIIGCHRICVSIFAVNLSNKVLNGKQKSATLVFRP